MLNKIDFQFLKGSLIFFIIALILSAGLILLGLQFEREKLAEYETGKSTLTASHRKYKKLVKDIDLIHLYTESYKDYKKTGLIGPERRLSWIETLESVNDVLKLPELTYSLAPQEGFVRPKFTKGKKIIVSSTPMELKMSLLHEEDIFSVFAGIKDNIDNLFTIDSCSISRKSNSSKVLNTRSANLTSNCLLRWITVDVQNK